MFSEILAKRTRGFAAAVLTFPGIALCQEPTPDPLDPAAHPSSPAYSPIFEPVNDSLEESLEWKQRFMGDERFNLESKPGFADRAAEVPTADPVAPDREVDGAGTIRRLMPDQGKVSIAHGPLERLGMPAMTMVFELSDPAMASELEAGDEVEFDLSVDGSSFVITRISPVMVGEVQGVVVDIRTEAQKIKVEHGPIARLGMPAMTMLFNVADPALMEGVSPGMRIAFDVDINGGGFFITRLRPLPGDGR